MEKTPAKAGRPLVLDVADLRRSSQGELAYSYDGPIPGLGSEAFSMPAGMEVKLAKVGVKIWAEGEAWSRAKLECSRCAGEFFVSLKVSFREDVVPGEGEDIEADQVDLEPLVRDHLLLEVPMQPICREDCPGLCPVCGVLRAPGACNCVPVAIDPRWEGLRSLVSKDQPKGGC